MPRGYWLHGQFHDSGAKLAGFRTRVIEVDLPKQAPRHAAVVIASAAYRAAT